MSMIGAVVLAAGRSRRMGTQKLLLPFQGQPLIARVVDELLHSPVDQVFVVIGTDGSPIMEALAGRSLQFVTNPNAGNEMLDSVRCGMLAMPEEATAAVVALGDQPGVTAEVVSGLVGAFHAAGRGILVPTHKGRRGHPLLVAMRYRDEILTRYDGLGLRGLLEAHGDDIFELEVGTPGILEDIDVPEDYQRAIDGLAAKDGHTNGPR